MFIKNPDMYKGKPTATIEGFAIGPDGPDRQKLINKLLEEDDNLAALYTSDEENDKLAAAKIFIKKFDTIYNIEPGEVIEVPDEHGEALLKTYGFLEKIEDINVDTTVEKLEKLEKTEDKEDKKEIKGDK